MKIYEKYKPSGIEWLGDIPAHWKVKRLAALGQFSKGGNISRSDLLFSDEGVPAILYGDLYTKYDVIVEKPVNRISVDTAKQAVRLFKGDLLFAGSGETKGDIGKCVLFNGEAPAYAGGDIIIFRQSDADSHFISYSQSSWPAHFQKAASSKGEIVVHTYGSTLKNVVMPYPPIQEQTAIADYLEKETARIDEVVGKKKRLIEFLKEERLAIINHAVTRGLDPNAKLKPSNIEWLGDIPKNWDVRRLKYLVSVKARLGWRGLKADEYVREGYGFLSTPNIKYNEIDFENINFITEERYLESPEIMLQIGDVVLAKDGSTLGIVNVVTNLPFPTTVNSSIAVLRVDDENIVFPSYLKYFLESHLMQSVIQWIKGGMGVPHLFQEDIREFNLLIPPISDQRKIADHVRAATGEVEKVIAKIEKEISLLNEYRTALISEVVTGKIKVF